MIAARPVEAASSRFGEAVFSAAAYGGRVAYQWYEGESGDTSVPIEDAIYDTLILSNVSEPSKVWVRATNVSGHVDSPAVDLKVGRLANISTRGRTEPGDNTMIVGFVLEGGDDLQLLLRVVGPTLGSLGVVGTASDPSIWLYRTGEGEVDFNDDWQTDLAAEKEASAVRTGAFALADGAGDATILITVPPGSYTAHADPGDGEPGVVLVEAYDDGGNSRVANILTRGLVGQGDSILIAGTVAEGAPRKLLIRAIGPTLGSFGVGGTIADTILEVYSGDTVIAENDNWGDAKNADAISSVSSTVGAFPLNAGSLDSAVYVTLDPGAYTVTVRGKDGVTGVALVEVYEVKGKRIVDRSHRGGKSLQF